MTYIRSRKKLVQTAVLTGQVATGSLMASTALHAQETPAQEIIQPQAVNTQTVAIKAINHAETVPTQTLDTIVITAKRTPAQQGFKVNKSKNSKYVAPLLDTPKSVQVISAQLIDDTQSTTLADALRTSPGVTLGAGEGGNPNSDRPFIRGFNAESAIYVDGVRNIGSQNREMFAVDSVEVTKGSASTLGGSGGAGGSINLASKVPQNKDQVKGSFTVGSDNYQRIEVDGNKVLGDGIAGRVAIMGHKNDKAGASDGAEYQRWGLAPSIAFGMGSPNRATLSYYYLHNNDIPDSGIPYNNPFSATSPHAKFNGDGQPIDVPQGTYYGWKDRDFQKQDNHIATLNLQHDFNPNLTLTNVTNYSHSKNDYVWTQPDDSKGNFINKTTGALDGTIWRRANTRNTKTDSFSNQLFLKGDMTTGNLRHRFNTGIEYNDTRVDRKQNINSGAAGSTYSNCPATALASGWCTPVLSPTQTSWNETFSSQNSDKIDTDTQQTAFYVLDNIELNPQWLLDLGMRWDKFNTGSVITKSTDGSKIVLDNDDDFFNYQAGITFKPKPNGSIYLSYATSANPVGLDFGDGSEGISATNKDLEPEKVGTLELGTKWDIIDKKLNLTAAIFRTNKNNTRVTNPSGTLENIGETRTDGLELTANGKLTDKWGVSAGYTYLDGKQIEAGMLNVAATGKPPVYTKSPATGKQIPQLAKHSASLWTTYQVMPQLTLGAGAFYSDKVYGNATNTKWVPSYVRYDAMARYAINRNMDLQLNVNNVTDKRYFSKAYASHYATEAEGRSTLLSLNFKY